MENLKSRHYADYSRVEVFEKNVNSTRNWLSD